MEETETAPGRLAGTTGRVFPLGATGPPPLVEEEDVTAAEGSAPPLPGVVASTRLYALLAALVLLNLEEEGSLS